MLRFKKYLSLSILALVCVFVTMGCGDSSVSKPGAKAKAKARAQAPPQNPLWGEYISAHNAGMISKKDKIRVRFVNPVVEGERVGQSAAEYLGIKPAIEGSVTFSDTQEIVVVPHGDLAAGQSYAIIVKANKLIDLPAELTEYKFTVDVIEQEFEVKVVGVKPEKTNKNKMVLQASLVTADVEDAEKIEKMVSAKYRGDSMPLKWQHDVDSRHHQFTISGIERDKTIAQEVVLDWDGSGIGVESKGSTKADIPSIDVFKVMKVVGVQGSQQHIAVSFSDNILKSQDIKGLVLVDNKVYKTRVDGNVIKIYPPKRFTGKLSVRVEKGLKNERGGRIEERVTKMVAFTSQKPQVRFTGRGVILPDNDVLSIPFEAINVNSVQVAAFRIYDNNVGQFLQSNKLDTNNAQERVGRYLWRKTIYLSSIDPDKWNRYSLDATSLLREHPGGLLRLTMSINRGNSTYSCTEAENLVLVEKEKPLVNSDDVAVVKEASSWDYAENNYSGSSNSSSWRNRNNPCNDAYYSHASGVTSSRNFLASNIGLMAKRGQRGRLNVVATNIKTAEVMKGVKISVMNFQDQELKSTTTDGNGFAELELQGTPFYLSAEKGREKGYLKLSAATALPLTHFDVGGEKVTDGIKGHIYGERGVWRPGDDIHLTFVLQDKDEIIPLNHPVTMKLYNPKGQLIQRVTNSAPVDNFYTFSMKTEDDALTGNWTAKAQLGGSTFSKKIRVEAVIPNRLRVELDLGKETLKKSDMPVEGKLFGQWLHGANAANLKADVKVRLKAVLTSFGRYPEYIFDDPARVFSSRPQTVFTGRLDARGYANFKKDLWSGSNAPGMLSAVFTSRVFEEGGAFSSSRSRFDYLPYKNFVGVKLPKGDVARGMLLTDVKHKVSIASVDGNGEPVSLNRVQVKLYKISWKWWWDKSGESLASYSGTSHRSAVRSGVISTKDGIGEWEFEIKYPAWGRYLLKACDMGGKHCSGKIVYIDWPGWAGRAREENRSGASVLSFFSDKENYKVGEIATIQLPEATQGRALVSIENGSGVLSQRWVEFDKKKTRFELPITKSMSPNIYVSVTLIQPHENKKNDRPIRMYGIIPINVKDPETILKPKLETADEWTPKSNVSVKVSEAGGRAMTYTVAVVDEGLLGLTAFRTPDLHRKFYKKEALGVSTWDIFDLITGAYGGELERLLALGGGKSKEEMEDAREEKKRFPPVVKFLGPFKLEPGKTNTHEFDMPHYVGAVRTMVVAGKRGAYGHVEKSIYVREPLTVLATLPRVIGPEEILTVPVSIFAMDKRIKDVELKVDVDEKFKVVGSDTVKVTFDEPGEKMGTVRLKVGDTLGMGRIGFKAKAAGDSGLDAESEIFIEVRSANQHSTRRVSKVLQSGESWEQSIFPHGLPGTNEVSLEVSAVPPIDLERRVKGLIRYPHGCVEQTTSSVFPQLYLPVLTTLNDENKKNVEKNVNAGIQRLRSFQVTSGGFVYWPNRGASATPHSWGTNYVGHFLLEAKALGYNVPHEMLSDWKTYQKSIAQSWSSGGQGGSNLDQAYRLYTLALAGQAQIGAMNRLRESSASNGLGNTARWQLAAAYMLAGQSDAAQELVMGKGFDVSSYKTPGATFGSNLRDKAIILNSIVQMADYEKAGSIVNDISTQLSAEQWHSTQSVAYALMAMSKFIGGKADYSVFTFEEKIGSGAKKTVKSERPIYLEKLKNFSIDGDTVMVGNTSGRTITVTVLSSGIPKAGREVAASSGLKMDVNYSDMAGNALDVSVITQGKDFKARIRVTNQTDRSYDNIALSHIAPSGWEIHNTRFDGGEALGDKIDYQDIRDDRVYTYFGLKAGESKVIYATFNAAYLGEYYLPGIYVEVMYDATKHARTRGQWVRVVKSLK